MHSVNLLLRDAMHKLGTLAVGWCPSTRLSVSRHTGVLNWNSQCRYPIITREPLLLGH